MRYPSPARIWMMATLAALLPAAPPPELAAEPAHPALAAKAPGAPGYGLKVATPRGILLMTSFAFDRATRRPQAKIYLVRGPAGWGPYRSGMEGHLSLLGRPGGRPGDPLHAVWYEPHFSAYGTPKGSPAARAGLDLASPFFAIDRVDGSSFDWNVDALTYYITQSPTVVVEGVKLPMFFGPSYSKRTVTNQRVEVAPGPAEAELQPLQTRIEALEAWLAHPSPWRALLQLRSMQPAFAPHAFDLDGAKRWAVLGLGSPSPEAPGKASRVLEIWQENPESGAFEQGLLDLWPDSGEGFQPGQAVRIRDRWYQIQAFAQDPATGHLTQLGFLPWKADTASLLSGIPASRALGRIQDPPVRESLEESANDALVEWKSLALPGNLAAQDPAATQALVIQIEKGLLKLDLEVKGIRSRLDAAARAEAERKAQAELAAKEGRPAAGPPQSATESERLADLLEQRKAILMAILGQAKQALAQLRR